MFMFENLNLRLIETVNGFVEALFGKHNNVFGVQGKKQVGIVKLLYNPLRLYKSLGILYGYKMLDGIRIVVICENEIVRKCVCKIVLAAAFQHALIRPDSRKIHPEHIAPSAELGTAQQDFGIKDQLVETEFLSNGKAAVRVFGAQFNLCKAKLNLSADIVIPIGKTQIIVNIKEREHMLIHQHRPVVVIQLKIAQCSERIEIKKLGAGHLKGLIIDFVTDCLDVVVHIIECQRIIQVIESGNIIVKTLGNRMKEGVILHICNTLVCALKLIQQILVICEQNKAVKHILP